MARTDLHPPRDALGSDPNFITDDRHPSALNVSYTSVPPCPVRSVSSEIAN